MVAALTRIFGVHNLGLAEDVVQDAFCRALEVWAARGMPDNPSAWLMTTAKNRALDVLRREQTARTFAPEMGRLLETEWTIAPAVDEAFAAHTIRDEQLRMMFSCCHPRLPEEVQVALILNILCGFGAAEIASAFLTGRAAIEKRISRGKKTLASAKRLFDLADAEFASRLSSVQCALYLLFNEGYHGASAGSVVRAELCAEAMRLTALLARASASGDARDERARGADVPQRRAASGANHARRRSESARRSGPLRVGRSSRRRRHHAARAIGGWGGDHRVSSRGRDRRRARERLEHRGDGLADDRVALRSVDDRRAVAGGRAQSRDCDRSARWAGAGAARDARHRRR